MRNLYGTRVFLQMPFIRHLIRRRIGCRKVESKNSTDNTLPTQFRYRKLLSILWVDHCSNRNDYILVHENDDPFELAKEFIVSRNLDFSHLLTLIEQIKEIYSDASNIDSLVKSVDASGTPVHRNEYESHHFSENSLTTVSLREYLHVKAELNHEKEQYNELFNEHAELLELVAQQEIELDEFRKSVIRLSKSGQDENVLTDVHERVRYRALSVYGKYVEFRPPGQLFEHEKNNY